MTSVPSGPLRVLVVSDNPEVRDELEWAFAKDAEVIFALEARDAWRELRPKAPDVVVVDLQTGSAGGFSLTRQMKATPDLAAIPVVILIDRIQDDWLARQAGGALSLVKPVAGRTVVAAVQELHLGSSAAK